MSADKLLSYYRQQPEAMKSKLYDCWQCIASSHTSPHAALFQEVLGRLHM